MTEVISEKWDAESADGSAWVRLNGRENVILRFDSPAMDEPFIWGFATIREWRGFLKMCARFDEALGIRYETDIADAFTPPDPFSRKV